MNLLNKDTNQLVYESFRNEMNDYKNLFKELKSKFNPSDKEEELFFCTSNYGKYVEVNRMIEDNTTTKEILKDQCKISFLDNSITIPEVEEDYNTFIGNAIKKALTFSRSFPDKVMIAEDSGLCVDALRSEPGVYSARYFSKGISNTDSIWVDKLIHRCIKSVMKDGLSDTKNIDKDTSDLLNKIMLIKKLKEYSLSSYVSIDEARNSYKANFVTVSAVAYNCAVYSIGYGETHGVVKIPENFDINNDICLDELRKGFGYNSLFHVNDGIDFIPIDNLSKNLRTNYNHRTIAHTKAIAGYLLGKKFLSIDSAAFYWS